MQTRGGARPKRGRDSQDDRAQATGPAHVAQPVAQPHDDLLAPPADAPAQASGSDPRAAQDGQGGEGSPTLLHRNKDIDMGYGPDEEEGSPGAGNTDEESDDDAQALIRPQLGFAEEREREASLRAQASEQAIEQRAATGVSPGGRPVAPPGLGRLARIVTPVGDMNGIDESAPGVVSYVWDDDPGCAVAFIVRGALRADRLAVRPLSAQCGAALRSISAAVRSIWTAVRSIFTPHCGRF